MAELDTGSRESRSLDPANDTALLLGIICAPVAFIMIVVGLVAFADFVPPPSPSGTADYISAIYLHRHWGIIAGGILTATGAGGPFLAFVCAISAVIRRIEPGLPVYTFVQMLGGAFVSMVMLVGSMMWVTNAYRPDRDPAVMLALNDFGWLFMVSTFGFGVIEYLAIGLAILGDRSETPLFPRWIAYLNFWVVFLILPAGVIPFFKAGPFSWDGLISFWVVVFVFGSWTLVMAWAMLRARKIINRTT
jgi:hypothetical protein